MKTGKMGLEPLKCYNMYHKIWIISLVTLLNVMHDKYTDITLWNVQLTQVYGSFVSCISKAILSLLTS